MKVLPVDLKSWGPGRSLLDCALDCMLAWSWESHAVLRVIDGLHLHTLMGFRLHTLMGSVCTHWWAPSAHTDGLRLHTLMGSVYTHWWAPSAHTDGLRLHTLMGSVCTHWWVLSTHTDGFCLHTLMPTPSTGRESVASKLPLNSFIHNLKRSRTRLISPSPLAASLLGQICKTAFIQNFK